LQNRGTPLMAAATKGNVEAARALLAGGADLEARDNGYTTALLTAAMSKQVRVHQRDDSRSRKTAATSTALRRSVGSVSCGR